jgi:hypothetical protein
VQIDALAVRLRPRTAMEAADLGVRLCQSAARSIYASYAMVGLPLVALSLATYQIADWLPTILLWWSKPWLDRTILFVLSRSAFGQRTRPADVWNAQRTVWWGQFFSTWTIRRLSMWRAFTQPVYQLEGFSLFSGHERVRQIRSRNVGQGLLMTHAFYLAECVLTIATLSFVFWFAPAGQLPDAADVIFSGEWPTFFAFALPVSYALVVLFLEPFYVAAGFAMYLNRRAELEAWDIEQEFRRAFVA